MSKGTKEEHK